MFYQKKVTKSSKNAAFSKIDDWILKSYKMMVFFRFLPKVELSPDSIWQVFEDFFIDFWVSKLSAFFRFPSKVAFSPDLKQVLKNHSVSLKRPPPSSHFLNFEGGVFSFLLHPFTQNFDFPILKGGLFKGGLSGEIPWLNPKKLAGELHMSGTK